MGNRTGDVGRKSGGSSGVAVDGVSGEKHAGSAAEKMYSARSRSTYAGVNRNVSDGDTGADVIPSVKECTTAQRNKRQPATGTAMSLSDPLSDSPAYVTCKRRKEQPVEGSISEEDARVRKRRRGVRGEKEEVHAPKGNENDASEQLRWA